MKELLITCLIICLFTILDMNKQLIAAEDTILHTKTELVVVQRQIAELQYQKNEAIKYAINRESLCRK